MLIMVIIMLIMVIIMLIIMLIIIMLIIIMILLKYIEMLPTPDSISERISIEFLLVLMLYLNQIFRP